MSTDEKRAKQRVCAECFNDDSIRHFVRGHAVSGACDFCERQSGDLVAAPWKDVLRFVLDGLKQCWTTDVRESTEYHVDGPPHSYDTRDLIVIAGEIAGISPIQNESVTEEVLRSTDDLAWYDRELTSRDLYGGLALNWDEFWHRVTRNSRFFFFVPMQGDVGSFEPPDMPAKILDELGDLTAQAGLVRTLPSGTAFFRARQHSPKHPVSTVCDLGPPPHKRALCANRMSPAGIVMFYGALGQRTALREVYDPCRADDGEVELTVGQFVTTADFAVVDLTNVPPVPSMFDQERRHLRSGVMFLHRFVDEVKLPVTKDGREHVEYVPTQVVTEYFRHAFRVADGTAIRGILYPSSMEPGGVCCVLFFENDQCSEKRGGRLDRRLGWLQLDNDSVEHFRAEACFTSSARNKTPTDG